MANMKNRHVPVLLPGEEWRGIVGYPSYEVSNLGRVLTHFTGPVILSQATKMRGYKMVILYSRERVGPNKSKGFTVHRLVAKAFLPNPTGFPVVHHKDANPSNNHVSNLEWTTQRENIRLAMVARGNWLAASPKRKTPIIQIDGRTGAEVRFQSIKAACDDLNRATVANGGIAKSPQLYAGNICHARNKAKMAYGFFWVSPRKRLALAAIRARFA